MYMLLCIMCVQRAIYKYTSELAWTTSVYLPDCVCIGGVVYVWGAVKFEL